MNKFYTAAEAGQYVFYKVPKALFTEDKYKALSTDTKMLYGLLLDRMHLSVKNGWTDRASRALSMLKSSIDFRLSDFKSSGKQKVIRLRK